MTLTEKEARLKTCPASLNAYSTAPGEVGSAYRDCVASACMAWRWAQDVDGRNVIKQVSPPSKCLDCKGTGTVRNDTDTDEAPCPECDGEGMVGYYEPTGYCGLAGRPANR
jgi:hypothetical protein